MAVFFEKNTLYNLRLLALETDAETQDIAHHLEKKSRFAEHTYTCTITAGNHSGGKNKLKVPNTFKEAINLPQAVHWKEAADKMMTSLKNTISTSWGRKRLSLRAIPVLADDD